MSGSRSGKVLQRESSRTLKEIRFSLSASSFISGLKTHLPPPPKKKIPIVCVCVWFVRVCVRACVCDEQVISA